MSVVVSEKGSVNYYSSDSLAEYVRRLTYIKIKKHLYFRGLADVRYDLSPSIDRVISGEDGKWLEKESRLVEFAEQRYPESFVKNSPALLISNMQHYGIPTRMMDITGNALIALYFACQETDDNSDGQVIVFDEHPVSSYNPYANIIADTYRLTNNAITSIDDYRYVVYQQPYASTLLYRDWENDRDDKLLECINRPLLVDVGAVNHRQINQDGKFILFPNLIRKGKLLNELATIDMSSEIVTAVIVIPYKAKKGILQKLELVGITNSFVFPDNIEIVIDGIKQTIKKEVNLYG